MRRLSIARSLQFALVGLTLALTTIAAIGVASLYDSRQTYEDRLADALRLQASAGKLLAAGVVEEATLRLATGPEGLEDRRRARSAFRSAFREAQELAEGDPRSEALVQAAADGQQALRDHPADPSAPLEAREPITALADRQDARISDARDEAEDDSRRALVAVIAGGGAALLVALLLIGALVAAVRRPLDDLVAASARLAGGTRGARVEEEGPDELRVLARSFNVMAGDVEAAVARVRAERDRLDVTVRSLGDALVQVDAEGTVLSANPRAAQLVPELATGDRATPPAPLEDALDGEVVVERGERTLAVTAARLGEDAGVVWTIRDVSERARLERLKSEFVATASHELRSPLTSIKGFVELLVADETLGSRQREFLEIVLVSTNRLVDLVGDLLDVARVEAGRLELDRRPTDLRDVVAEVTSLLRPRIAEKRQELVVEVDPDLSRVDGDAGRLRQILTNLLTNAHLYTDEGGHLAVRAHRRGASAVDLVVADDGRGMSDDELERVFERFVRAGAAERTQGSGLGLAIVRSLVELHDGAIDVVSVPGEGTTFTVTLPAARRGEPSDAARAALRGRHVLVLDDEPSVAALISERLAELGARTTVVHDGTAALAALRDGGFDALTLDILMPGMSGFEVMRALRSDPALEDIPAVVVSVFSGREALSGERVVSKPIDADELVEALGSAVLAGRARVLSVGRAAVRDRLDAVLHELGIEHDWASGPREVAAACERRRYEVALVDAGLEDPAGILAALDLRGRRLERAVVVFTDGDGTPAGFARLDADPVPIDDAGRVILDLLDAASPSTPHSGPGGDG